MENIQKHYSRGEINKANQSSSIGLIIRQKEPKVLETLLDRVDSFLTPTELFYVRSHSPAPKREGLLSHGRASFAGNHGVAHFLFQSPTRLLTIGTARNRGPQIR